MSKLRINIRIIVASIAVLLVVFSFLSWSRNRDLTYEGRHLVDWLALIESSSPSQSASAEHAIREIGIDALPLLEDLVQHVHVQPGSLITTIRKMQHSYFKKKIPNAESKVLRAYGALGKKAVPSVPFLVEQLKADEILVRQTAAGALGMIGPSAKEAVPDLILSLNDESYWVRQLAALSLGKICADSNDANIVAALEKLLNDESIPVRIRTVRAIGMICAHSNDANIVEALKKSLDDENKTVRAQAAYAFGMIYTDTNDANIAQGLEKLLNDEDSEVRRHAERAITSMQEAEGPKL